MFAPDTLVYVTPSFDTCHDHDGAPVPDHIPAVAERTAPTVVAPEIVGAAAFDGMTMPGVRPLPADVAPLVRSAM